MGRAEEHAAYRAEVERLNKAATTIEPDYSGVQRRDWENGFELPESKRPAFCMALLDSFFTGIDPSPRLTAAARKVWAPTAIRVRHARASAIGKRKKSPKYNPALMGGGDTDERRESVSNSNQNQIEFNSNSVAESDSKSHPNSSAANYGLPATAGHERTDVGTDVGTDVLPITYQPTTYGKPNPLRFGLADRLESFNPVATQLNLSGAGKDEAQPPEPFIEPTPEQVQGWWGDEGYSWAMGGEGRSKAAEFIEERKRQGISLPASAGNPFAPVNRSKELEGAWKGLASVFASAYDRQRAS